MQLFHRVRGDNIVIMIGINFKIKSEYGSPLRKIFNKVSTDKYYWKIEFSEVYKITNQELDYKIFYKDIMNGKEFENESNIEVYYMIFLTTLAFKNKEDIIQINDYSDFEKSKCEIAFICSDTEYISVFCKDKSILEQILNNCRDNNFEKIEIITDENDAIFSFI